MSNIFQIFKRIPRPYVWSIFSGVLVGTSYIPFPGWALLFCYIPFWFAARQLDSENASLKKVFVAGWLTQFVLTLIGFNWVFYTASEFGNFNWIISLGALLAFAAGMHIYIPLAAVFSVWLFRRQKIQAASIQFLIFGLSLALFERVWPSIFEWNLAYSLLYMRMPLFQWADIVGFWGLSTWILLAQAALGYSLSLRRTNKKMALQIASSVILVVLTLSGLGLIKEKNWSRTDSSVQFGLVQGNIGNAEKVQSEKKENFQSFILESFSNLTDQLLQKNPQTEIVLWPETSLPFALDPYFHQRYLQQILLQKVQQWNLVLVTGAYSQSLERKDHLGYPLTRNSVFYLSPEKILAADTYNKTALLVFGEYLPFGEQLPFLYKLFPFVGVYERGPGPTPQTIKLKDSKTITLGPQICYESLDPSFSRGLSKKGAQIIFNVTNDSWFGWWAEPFQHNIMTLARAVEVRRPLIRSTNTGISGAILANGQILEASTMNVAWVNTFQIAYLKNARQTFYTLYGHLDWLVWLLLLGLCVTKGKHVRD